VLLRELGAATQVIFLRLALEQLAHPLARSVHRGRQRPVAGARERSDELVLEAVRPQGRQPDLPALIGERVHDVHDARVIADGRADEPDTLGVLGDEREDLLHRREAHAAVGRAAHHAVRALARAAALGLDEEHVAEHGVRRADGRPRGDHLVRHLRDGREDRAVVRGHEDVRDRRERFEPRGA
jgi:hypothetical protein